ncbi:YrdB family protein [Paenibacillus sp. An7]|uniref:YrdB family protein n=1 Tax=Paenibacillus sp. An7 TaxID=2689577 RepID=UPI00135C88A0|nr:YrdB family protein [Paenibacillus sp. An7]
MLSTNREQPGGAMHMYLMMTWINLTLRGLMELGIVIAFAQWGYHMGKTTGFSVLLSITAPLVMFSIWSLFDFRNVVSTPEPFRLVQEMFISLLAAVAWYISGHRMLGLALAIISIIHHIMVYALGYKLLQ